MCLNSVKPQRILIDMSFLFESVDELNRVECLGSRFQCQLFRWFRFLPVPSLLWECFHAFRTGSVLLGPCFVHPSIKTYVAYAVKIAPMHFKGQELLLETLQ